MASYQLSPLSLVGSLDDNFLLGEIDDGEEEIASGIAADMQSIKERLRVETEFNGVDAWDLKEEEFERAMELGLLPLPVGLPQQPQTPIVTALCIIRGDTDELCFCRWLPITSRTW